MMTRESHMYKLSATASLYGRLTVHWRVCFICVTAGTTVTFITAADLCKEILN